MFEFCPSCCTVDRTSLVYIFRYGLETGNINDGIHRDSLPCTHDHDCNPCPSCACQHTCSFASQHLNDCRKNICKEVVENITYNQCSKNVRNEIHSSQSTLKFNLAVQSKCQNQTDYVYHDRTQNSQLKGEPVRMSHAGVCKQIDIVTQTNPVIRTISFKVGKTVDHTFDQRQCVKAEEQCHNRYGHQQKCTFSFCHLVHLPSPFYQLDCFAS